MTGYGAREKKGMKKRRGKMIIAELSIIPLGTKTTAVGKYVKAALKELEKQSSIRAEPEAMGTIIEAENMRDLFKAVEKAHNSVFDLGVTRVVTEIRIDERRDKEATIESKTKALK
ncbi:MAG: MTH1187 family thiamine-binding protein [Methanolinea sp.]|nr:MTH1187 family thiamine-binding protein [Methanolinea sp.]